MTTSESSGPGFRVVTVCYANLCRSPLMEFMLQQLADARDLGWVVSSAGVNAADGLSMHRHARRVLVKRGMDPGNWVSRQVNNGVVADADLILTATEATRDVVLRQNPNGLARTFTLLHFAYLTRGLEPYEPTGGFGPWVLDQAHRSQGRLQPLPREARDIADPMGHSYARFRRCARVIEEALEVILEPLPGPRWSWRLGG